ncbi:MAG: multicopper oxidase domain-containing protein, partial [Proteobacteria bacterium]|nr:multicopper oxidase domain-containing protein [Pseudomonadota bacterium]
MSLFRRFYISLCIFLMLVSVAMAHGWMAPKKESMKENPVKKDSLSINLGKTLFSQTCTGCHGEDAKGLNPEATGLDTRPPDLTQSIKTHTDGDLFWKISTGRKDMPSFKDEFEEKETWSIIHFIRTLGQTIQPVAAITEYALTIEMQKITINGKTAQGMTINGSIPGPELKFKEEDIARIKVHNKMTTDTSLHWHGLLVPPGMDGVPYISFPPIKPGATFTYEFPIRQSGTYWYHSHTHHQEQKGLYGAIVIEPKTSIRHTDLDAVVLLSDWTTEDPNSILKTLKRGSEWYPLQKGSSQSIIGAVKKGALGSYFKRELLRMPPMDIADVAYDYFLANGKPETFLSAAAHDMVRLRIINGSATTYFYLEFAGGPLKIISADGQTVQPVNQKRFLAGVAETYDVLLSPPGPGSYEFRATAHDGSGFSSVWIGSGKRFAAPDIPTPNLYQAMEQGDLKTAFALTPNSSIGMTDRMIEHGQFDTPGMTGMKDMGGMSKMEEMKETNTMGGMDEMKGMAGMDTMQQEPASPETAMADMPEDGGISPERPWPPYAVLRSPGPTSFSKDKPVRKIRITLDGDMERYVWLLNNKVLSESDAIHIKKGEIVRFIMINRTMMHHPMHLHGHFFRVINEQQDHSPLKHTVDVAPMSTTIIEFNANEFGDWFFHCHLLYHMASGMARMVHYQGFEPPAEVTAIQGTLFKDPWYFWGQADALSSMTEGFLKVSNTRNIVTAQWQAGWQDVDDTQWEGILTLDRYVNRFFTVFSGITAQGEDDHMDNPRGLFGFHYLFPLNIES